ncbi:MAG: 5'/3'-nucleotidase SurE [Deltaproteobacteria bacterium]|nr:5'/3'-nucleotidase SurE [Deltaproteobacteria bacterium]MBK8237671.1 5'/3'-nucleotidase SurE [Deltaproteobacteria bacterium]MBK8719450.1 5'/3'-nucleotidase SurE [Deltaproteobacteria bacterium]MBP7290661.1 5'/3'-nucleotidase SurE [Nannocystaceae bacterium]
MTRPLILVTNDDGVLAPGIAVLAEALAEVGEVIVCAPETERSGSGHAISFHTHLRAQSIRPGWWYLTGTPVDCVYFAMMHLCERPPDLVCSGINAGYNLGSDVFYSGTVGGAAEGYLRGVRALAISAERGEHGASWAAPVAVRLAQRLLAAPAPLLVNCNVPARAGVSAAVAPTPAELAAPRRICVTRLGQRRYRDGVQPRTDPMGRPYYWIGGPPEPGSTDLDHDTGAVAAHLVAITPLHMDLTAPDLGPAQALVADLADAPA